MTVNCTDTGAETYDVCIIGAGPAGLSVTSALHNPEGIMRTTAQWKQWTHASRYRNMARRAAKSARRTPSVCIVDPSGCWLSEWKGRFRSLGIDMLRSPAWATPDYFSTEALLEFAFKTGRQQELQEIKLPQKAHGLLRDASEGLFHLPGSVLFEDFCDDLSSKLPHTFVPGKAESVEKLCDGMYNVILAGHTNSVRARHVVFALGAANTPKIVAPLAQIYNESAAAPNPRVVHTYSWKKLLTAQFVNETVVVVGGGLSAAQAALLAVRRGASRVVLVSRRKMQTRHYDLPFEWLHPQSGWRVACKDKSRCAKFRMFEFFDTPKPERAAWVRSARGGATVPAKYLEELECVSRIGRLELRIDEIAAAERTPDGESGGPLRLSFCHGSSSIVTNRVILATGSALDVNQVPLLNSVAARFDLPIVDSLPDLDDNLSWGNENFTVVGGLAILQVGPDAGNLTGCRRSAEICASHLGAFETFNQVGGPLSNTYSILFNSDSESDDDGTDCNSDSDP